MLEISHSIEERSSLYVRMDAEQYSYRGTLRIIALSNSPALYQKSDPQKVVIRNAPSVVSTGRIPLLKLLSRQGLQ